MPKSKRKTWAEYKRDARKRERERKRDRPDAIDPYLRHPFFDFYREDANASDYELALQIANITPPAFDDDGPAVFPETLDGLDTPDAKNSIERAQLVVACLVDAASGLAGIINRYKQREIDAALAALEARDLSDPNTEKDILAEIARLKSIRTQLKRQVRWSFPQWKITGE